MPRTHHRLVAAFAALACFAPVAPAAASAQQLLPVPPALTSVQPFAFGEPLRPVVPASQADAAPAATGRTTLDAGPALAAALARRARSTASAKATKTIVTGATAEIGASPWQVFLLNENGDTASTCGGSIVNETTIITAAHCMTGIQVGKPFDQNGMAVIAGMSNVDVDVPNDGPQTSLVTAARVHPGYGNGAIENSPTGDIAVLTITPKLNLTGPYVKPIALPASTAASADGEPIPVGPATRVTGYGVQSANGTSNGQLYGLDGTVVDPDYCGSFPNATGLCVRAATGAVCSGDSGGGLVSGGVLVGVVSTGPIACTAGDAARFTSLLAPENRQFVDGAPAPAVAPRQTAALKSSASSSQVGGVVTCNSAAFSGAGVSTKYVITNDLGQRLAATVGAGITYTLAAGDAGRKIQCRAYGSNGGGVASTELLSSGVISAAPVKPPVSDTSFDDLQVYASLPRAVRRGGKIKVKVTISGAPAATDGFLIAVGKPSLTRSSLTKAPYRVKHQATGASTSFTANFGPTMPRRAKVGRKYKVRVQAYTHLEDGTADDRQRTFMVRAKR